MSDEDEYRVVAQTSGGYAVNYGTRVIAFGFDTASEAQEWLDQYLQELDAPHG